MSPTLLIGPKSILYGGKSLKCDSHLLSLAIDQLNVEDDITDQIVLRSSWIRYLKTSLANPKLILSFFSQSFRRFQNISLNKILVDLKFALQVKQVEEWTVFLRKNEFDLILGIGIPRSLLIASNSLKINSVEVQHGVLTAQSADFYWSMSLNGLEGKPNAFLGWDNHFKKVIVERQIIFIPLQGLWPNQLIPKKSEIQKNSLLVLLQNKTFLFLNLAYLQPEIRKYLKTISSETKKRNVYIKLHPVSYSFSNKLFIRLILFFIIRDFKITTNSLLRDILPTVSQIATTKSAGVWEAWHYGVEVIHFGDLPENWYSKEIIESPLFMHAD